MIRYIYDNKTDEFMATAAGSMADVLAELCVLLSTCYNLIRSQDPQAAEVFREGVAHLCKLDSPVWDKEDVPDPVDGYKLVHVWREEAHDDDV